MSRLRIVLADDHQILREGIRALLANQDDMEVVGEAENGRAAIAVAMRLRPDVVVMDVSMPDVNGLAATQQLSAQDPPVKVVALTRHTDRAYVQQLLRAGAAGYVLKQSASEELVRALRAVAMGHMYVDPVVAASALPEPAGSVRLRGALIGRRLTAREEQILRLIAWGMLSREIAEKLSISTKTVDAHKSTAMRKLGMRSRIDIMQYAVVQGWLSDA